MEKTGMKQIIGVILVCALLAGVHACGEMDGSQDESPVWAESGIVNWDNETMREEWAYSAGLQAYIYGYPMVDFLNRYAVVESVDEMFVGTVNGEDSKPMATINHICFLSDYASPSEQSIGNPNADTLYGTTYFNLESGPVIIRVPDMQDHYWIAELCRLNNEVFASPGTRRGSKPGNYLLVGPGWSGTIPDDIVEVIKAPENVAYVLFRVLMKKQEREQILPLINQITSGTLEEIDTIPLSIEYANLTRIEQPNVYRDKTPDDTFWQTMRTALDIAAIPDDEKALVETFRQTGLGLSEDPAITRGLNRAMQEGKTMISDKSQYQNLGPDTLPGGWNVVLRGGDFGADYLTRAAQVNNNTYIHLREDALYYYNTVDSTGEILDGNSRYRIHFNADGLPPNDQRAFWSITVYGQNQFFVRHPSGRYNIGTVTEPVHVNTDGSVDLFLQYDQPEGNDTNWLPIPQEPFLLNFRVYMPDSQALDGKYYPPAVVRAD